MSDASFAKIQNGKCRKADSESPFESLQAKKSRWKRGSRGKWRLRKWRIGNLTFPNLNHWRSQNSQKPFSWIWKTGFLSRYLRSWNAGFWKPNLDKWPKTSISRSQISVQELSFQIRGNCFWNFWDLQWLRLGKIRLLILHFLSLHVPLDLHFQLDFLAWRFSNGDSESALRHFPSWLFVKLA